MALGPGSIAFTGFNADGNDNLSFVVLEEIASGTTIHFQDNEWNGTAFNSGESAFSWTATGTIAAGTIVTIDNIGTGTISSNLGTVGVRRRVEPRPQQQRRDRLCLCRHLRDGADRVPDRGRQRHRSSTAAARWPDTGLTAGVNALEFAGRDPDTDIAAFNGSRGNLASLADYAAVINNPANWTSQDGDRRPVGRRHSPRRSVLHDGLHDHRTGRHRPCALPRIRCRSRRPKATPGRRRSCSRSSAPAAPPAPSTSRARCPRRRELAGFRRRARAAVRLQRHDSRRPGLGHGDRSMSPATSMSRRPKASRSRCRRRPTPCRFRPPSMRRRTRRPARSRTTMRRPASPSLPKRSRCRGRPARRPRPTPSSWCGSARSPPPAATPKWSRSIRPRISSTSSTRSATRSRSSRSARPARSPRPAKSTFRR